MQTSHIIYISALFLLSHGIHGFLASLKMAHEWSFYSLISLSLMILSAGLATGAFFSRI